MKRAWLLHGTGGSYTDYFWFADTARYLIGQGYEVWWPQLPHTERPILEETLRYIEENMPPLDGETILIGHSSACPLLLTLLEHAKTSVKQAILVAGFYMPLDDGMSELMIQKEPYYWKAIR